MTKINVTLTKMASFNTPICSLMTIIGVSVLFYAITVLSENVAENASNLKIPIF